MLNKDFYTPIGDLMSEVTQWADEVIPGRTDASMMLKMYSEMGELVDAPDDPMEVADIFIMMLDYARRKGISVTEVVQEKLQINRQRQWTKNTVGAISHVKGADE